MPVPMSNIQYLIDGFLTCKYSQKRVGEQYELVVMAKLVAIGTSIPPPVHKFVYARGYVINFGPVPRAPATRTCSV